MSARVDGAPKATGDLNGLAAAARGADAGFTDVAKRIAGFTTIADIAVRATQATARAIIDLGKESIVLAAGFEKAKISWGVLLGDMAKGEKMFEAIRTYAAETPLSFEGLESAARMLAQYGIEAERIMPTLAMLGDVSMGDDAALSSLARAFGQIQSTGRLMGQDLLQLINAGFNPLLTISEKTGESMADLKKRMEQGGVSADEVTEAFKAATEEGGRFYGMMDKTAETTSGKWSTAMDNFKGALAELGEHFLPLVNRMLDVFNANMDEAAARRNVQDALGGGGDVASAIARVTADRARLEAELGKLREQAMTADARVLPYLNSGMLEIEARLAEANRKLVILQIQQAAQYRSGEAKPTPAGALPPPPLGSTGGGTGTGGGAPTASDIIFGGTQGSGPLGVAKMGGFSTQGGTGPTTTYQGGLGTDNASIADGIESAAYASERLAASLALVSDALGEFGKQAFVDSFKSLGEALASGANAGEAMAMSLAELGRELLDKLPMMLLNAGLTAISVGQVVPGLALIGASGLVALGSGIAEGSIEANADGNVYSSPSLHQYANKVYDKPQFFAFARGGVFAEAGPEAIMPLARDSSGRLGVRSEGGANVSVVVNNNAPNTEATATETTGPNGERQIVVAVEAVVGDMVRRGKLDGLLARGGMRPVGART